jgi:SET domain
MNHNDRPNVYTRLVWAGGQWRVCAFALRDVLEDEELFIDYHAVKRGPDGRLTDVGQQERALRPSCERMTSEDDQAAPNASGTCDHDSAVDAIDGSAGAHLTMVLTPKQRGRSDVHSEAEPIHVHPGACLDNDGRPRLARAASGAHYSHQMCHDLIPNARTSRALHFEIHALPLMSDM